MTQLGTRSAERGPTTRGHVPGGADRGSAPRAPGSQLASAAPPAVLTYLRLHWLLILFCGTLLGAPAAYLAWTLLPGKYGSSALIVIDSNPLSAAGGDPGRTGQTAFDIFVRSQKVLIRSDLVLNAALNKGIGKLPTLAEQRDPIKFLKEKLVVDTNGSEVLEISLEGERPDDIRQIVNAVKDAYLDECVETDKRRKQGQKQEYEASKTALATMVRTLLTPTVGLRADESLLLPAGGVPPRPSKPATEVDPRIKQVTAKFSLDDLGRLRGEQRLLPQRASKLQAEGAGLAAELEAVKAAAPSAEMAEALDRDPEVLAAKQEAARLRSYYLSRRRTHPGGDGSEFVRALSADAEAAEVKVGRVRDGKLATLVRTIKGPEAARIVNRLKVVQDELAALKEREKALPVEIEAATRDLSEGLPPEVQQASATAKALAADPKDTDVSTASGVYARVAETVLRLDLDLKSPNRVRAWQPASNPSLKDGKKQLMATVAAGLLGFALVAGGVVVVETRAKRVCSLAELAAATPAPVVGVLPALPTGDDPLARAAVAEAVDKLRSRVTQSYLACGATTLAVTSAVGDEGKAATAFGLANSLALAGFKTLLIDCDLRAPALHALAGVPNQDGVCELLLGQMDPRQAMFVLANGLHFVPAGAFSEPARAAAVGAKLAGLLGNLGERFDCVVLLGHPLLAAAEAVEVARRADAVLVCGQYRESRLPLLRRAIDRLAVMEVPHAGIVYLGATPHEALC